MFKAGDQVKLKPTAVEDEGLRSNHHLLARILEEDRSGNVREIDGQRSGPAEVYYWVKFHYAAILLPGAHLQAAVTIHGN